MTMLAYEPPTMAGYRAHRGRPQPGTVALVDACRFMAPSIIGRGITRAEIIRVGRLETLSLHHECRAADLFVPAPIGWPLALRIVAAADQLGVCELIYDRKRVSANAAGRPVVRRYTGPSPHLDHIHVGQTRRAAANTSAHADLVRYFVTALAA